MQPKICIWLELSSGEQLTVGPGHPAGWICADCRTYNSLQRLSCRQCGTIHQHTDHEIDELAAREAAQGGDSTQRLRPHRGAPS